MTNIFISRARVRGGGGLKVPLSRERVYIYDMKERGNGDETGERNGAIKGGKWSRARAERKKF